MTTTQDDMLGGSMETQARPGDPPKRVRKRDRTQRAQKCRCVHVAYNPDDKSFTRCEAGFNAWIWWQRWPMRCPRHAVKPKDPRDPKTWEREGDPLKVCAVRKVQGASHCSLPAIHGRAVCFVHAGSEFEEMVGAHPAFITPRLMQEAERGDLKA